LLTARSHFHQQLHDGFLMYAGHADYRTDRTALSESGDNSQLFSAFSTFMGPPLIGDPGRCIL
jgi:hypothetical protein